MLSWPIDCDLKGKNLIYGTVISTRRIDRLIVKLHFALLDDCWSSHLLWSSRKFVRLYKPHIAYWR
jgi:hypothetical protein